MTLINKYNPLLSKGIQKIDVKIVKITYNNLYNLIGHFDIGQMYEIIDFATKYDQRTAKGWILKEANIEPLVVTAISQNSLSPLAYSALYPQDIIYYDLMNNTTNQSATSRTGNISYREDTTTNVRCEFDFRNVLHNRYEVIAPEWTSGYNYNSGNLVSYNSIIYKLINSVVNSIITPDEDIDNFKNLGIYNQELLVDYKGRLPNCGVIDTSYIGINNKDYLTFTNIDDSLVLDTKISNIFIGKFNNEIPDIIFIRTYNKFVHSIFSNISCTDVESLTVMQAGLINAEFSNILYGSLFSWNDPISTSFKIENCFNFLMGRIVSSFISKSKITARDYIADSRISNVEGSTEGIYESTLESCTINVNSIINSSTLNGCSLYLVRTNLHNCKLNTRGLLKLNDYNLVFRSIFNLVAITNISIDVNLTSATYIFNQSTSKEIIAADNNAIPMLKFYDEFYNTVLVNLED